MKRSIVRATLGPGSPGNPLDIVPQPMPSITWREARQDDKGYAITDVNPVTGEQRYTVTAPDEQSSSAHVALDVIETDCYSFKGGLRMFCKVYRPICYVKDRPQPANDVFWRQAA